MPPTAILWLLIGSYLLGSIPNGYLIGRLYGVDIRRLGSGNIGATNILRAVGRLPAGATLLLDAVKGWLPVMVSRQFFGLTPGWLMTIGFLAIIGHTFPVFLHFKGGKGVATGFGVLIGLSPATAFFLFLIWLVVAAVSRVVSLASLTAAIFLPLFLWYFTRELLLVVFGILIAAAVIINHRSNIRRILAGTEPRLEK